MLTLGDLSAFTLFVRCRNCQRQEVMQVTSLPLTSQSFPVADALAKLRCYRCRALGWHVVELRWHLGRPPPSCPRVHHLETKVHDLLRRVLCGGGGA